MFYSPSQLVTSQPTDLNKAFDPTQCPPQRAQDLNEIIQLRNNFYNTFQMLSQKGEHELINEIDWMPLMTYLNKGPNLLEHGAAAQFCYEMSWLSGAFPGGWHNITNENEVASTTEILMSRILYATGLTKSCCGHVSSVRNLVSQGNAAQAKDLIGQFTDRLLSSAVRLYKLNYCASLIYPGLKDQNGPLECARDFASSLYL